MKKLVIIIAGVIVLLLLPFGMWTAEKDTAMQVSVLDKTVPKGDTIGHDGLFWLLNHLKIVKSDGTLYETKTDYYGSSGKEEKWRALPEDLSASDLIYVADIYGIDADGERGPATKHGLSQVEWQSIQQAVRQHHAKAVIEYDSSPPTDPSVRKEVGELVGIKQTGWTVRWVSDLRKGGLV